MRRKFTLTEGKWDKDIFWKFIISQKIPALKECSAVFCVPIYRNGVVLVNHPTRGWSFPGGHLEHKESLADAVRREVLEETGLIIQDSKLFGYKRITHLKPVRHRDYPHFYPFPFAYMPYYLTILQEPLRKIIDKNNENNEVELVSFGEALFRLAGPEKNDIILKYLIKLKMSSD